MRVKPNNRKASGALLYNVGFILALALASGILVNLFRPLPLPWKFDPITSAQGIGNSSGQSTVDLTYMMAALGRKNTTVIDARAELFYMVGHIPGALNIPPDQIAVKVPALLNQVPETHEIIVYCSDPMCPMAETVVKDIVSRGRSAKLFPTGFSGWEAAKQRVEGGN